MLESGFNIVDGIFHDSSVGTPQGGFISPAIAYFVLRKVVVISLSEVNLKGFRNVNSISYAEDFVFVFSPWLNSKKETIDFSIKLAMIDIVLFLAKAGLRFKEAKTSLIAVVTPFSFLGFQFASGLGLIPDPKNTNALLCKVRLACRKYAIKRIGNINAFIRGFYIYFSYFSSEKMW